MKLGKQQPDESKKKRRLELKDFEDSDIPWLSDTLDRLAKIATRGEGDTFELLTTLLFLTTADLAISDADYIGMSYSKRLGKIIEHILDTGAYKDDDGEIADLLAELQKEAKDVGDGITLCRVEKEVFEKLFAKGCENQEELESLGREARQASQSIQMAIQLKGILVRLGINSQQELENKRMSILSSLELLLGESDDAERTESESDQSSDADPSNQSS